MRQPDSTLVAVSIFLLLTSLTYLLFKLSPRSVLRGVCAHVLMCYLSYVCVCELCVHVSVCVHPWVCDGEMEGQASLPLFLPSPPSGPGCSEVFKPLLWTSGEFPSCQVYGEAVWPQRAVRESKVTETKSPEVLRLLPLEVLGGSLMC